MPFLLEMHAAVWDMEHISHHLKGKRFLLFTDHKLLEKLCKVHTKTLHHILEAIMDYDFEMHYKKVEEMPGDFLSCNVCALTPELSLENIGHQQQDPQLSTIICYLKTGSVPHSKVDRQLIARHGSQCFLDNDVLQIHFPTRDWTKSSHLSSCQLTSNCHGTYGYLCDTIIYKNLCQWWPLPLFFNAFCKYFVIRGMWKTTNSRLRSSLMLFRDWM